MNGEYETKAFLPNDPWCHSRGVDGIGGDGGDGSGGGVCCVSGTRPSRFLSTDPESLDVLRRPKDSVLCVLDPWRTRGKEKEIARKRETSYRTPRSNDDDRRPSRSGSLWAIYGDGDDRQRDIRKPDSGGSSATLLEKSRVAEARYKSDC
ncbi:hypothetical protein V1478_000610 [Vespula squamosa]|uniref:Uncharacterized protein n=1 Tax=Vespula squamosa TaxID=30214 RepID=A0ABD2C5Z8_VESSQ